MKLLLPLLLWASVCCGGEYRATVLSVHDGDTATVRIRLGLGVSVETKVRLMGINAPELKTGKPGDDARIMLEKLISGKEIKLVTNDKHEHEKYGRVLGTIFCDGININKKMVEDGFAIKYMEE